MVERRGAGRSTGGPGGVRAAVALLVLLLVAMVLVVPASGPVTFGEPRMSVVLGLDAPADLVPGDPPAAGEASGARDEEGLPGWLTVVWTMAVGAALVLAVRWVARLLHDDERGDDREPVLDGGVDPRLLDAILRGIREAGAALERPSPGGDEHDAVIRCWLALEDAGARVGTARDPAQTPTEFTAALLTSQQADPEATGELLSLYHRARFGSAAPSPGTVHAARDAVRRIAASLEDRGSPAPAPVGRTRE